MKILSVHFVGDVRVPGAGRRNSAEAHPHLHISVTECGRFVRLAATAVVVLVPMAFVRDLNVDETETTAKPKRGSK